ncbi:alpha/beta fold hydrolase [Thalassotalea sp. PLHSN55]|uniref:alpha/beta hydrolase family protein n=1 Tax=Thalassotalea sp. PLHSN55 TaxID=3435888 RepID=UPI003F8328E2
MRILIVILLTIPNFIFAQNAEIPLEAYGNLPKKSMLVISPNAERLAYRDTTGGRDIMMVVDIKTNTLISGVNLEGVNPDNAYFIDNDRLILVASKNRRMYGYRGRHDISAAFAYNVTSGKIHQLLSAGYHIHEGQTKLGSIMGISPDKKYAYMPAYGEDGRYNLYRVSLERRKKPRVHRKGTRDTIDFFIDQEGEVVARERYNNETDTHLVQSVIDGEWVDIFKHKSPYITRGFSGLTPDGKSLVMLNQDANHRRWAYYTMSLTDGAVSEAIFSRKDKDVEHVISDIQRVVHGVQYSGFTPTYEFFDKKLNARMRGINKVMPNNTFTIRDYTPDWSSMLFFMDGEASSGDYLLYNNSRLGFLTQARPEVPPEAVNTVKSISFNARDNWPIPTLVTMPKGKGDKNLPAIMMPHGGPESYDKLGFDWMAQYFANQGYVVIQPQFRGSTGFGSAHLLRGRGEWGRKMQDDLTDAVTYLAKQGTIDKNRVCIVGSSYGGYAALAGAAFTPELYKCVVSINGVSDVERMLDTEERNYGRNHWVVSYWQDVIADGDVDEDHLEQISPANHAKKVQAPVLLIHGEHDLVVPIRQSKIMRDELEDADKQVTFVELDNGNHHLSKRENRLKALKAIDKFIKEYI